MEKSSENTSNSPSLKTRLEAVQQMLGTNPAQANKVAGQMLDEIPGQPDALLYLGISYRLLKQPDAAIKVLQPLCAQLPHAAMAHMQLGLAWRETRQPVAAVESFRHAVTARQEFGDAWLALADTLTELSDRQGANDAFLRYIQYSTQEPELRQATDDLTANRTADAEWVLRKRLERHPNDVAALCMLADIAMRHVKLEEAVKILARCVDLAPGYATARHNYAIALMRTDQLGPALTQVDQLLQKVPENRAFLGLKAVILGYSLDYDGAISIYRKLLDTQPEQPSVWVSLGNALRATGQSADCIAAYRKAMQLAPLSGEAAWSLSNLKTAEIADNELEAMQSTLNDPQLAAADRTYFNFAIAKALEDRQDYAAAFEHYALANRNHRADNPYAPEELTQHTTQAKSVCTEAFFEQRAGWGSPASDPIFIIGLPRAGSTLVEQVLASHSLVEGTPELPQFLKVIRAKANRDDIAIGSVVEHLTQDDAREMADAYLQSMAPLRPQARAFFIDKMPNNFMHLGLIHLLFPAAKIIDVRRHPLGCGFSIFKQHFAHSQLFSYDLADIGRFYRDYVDLLEHFERVLPPGRIHRVNYENLVEDTETEIRRLLQHCGLEFEDNCLKFNENKRSVSTASSEQVRQPIFRSGLNQWQNFETWLGPLKDALGPVNNS